MKSIKKKLFFSLIFLCSNVVATQEEVTQLATQYGFVASTSDPIFDDNGLTALNYVIELNLPDASQEVGKLIKAGADVNLASKDGVTPLLNAIYSKNIDIVIVNALIKAGAKVNLVAKDGSTPLFNAIYVDNLDIVNALIKAKANVNLVAKDGSTPLGAAISSFVAFAVGAFIPLIPYVFSPKTDNLPMMIGCSMLDSFCVIFFMPKAVDSAQ